MRGKGVLAMAVFTCLLIAGGWLLQRGLGARSGGILAGDAGFRGNAEATPLDVDGGRHLYEQVLSRIQARYVDSISAESLYQKTVTGVMRELHDPQSVYLPPDRLARLERTRTGATDIGAQVDARDDWIMVTASVPGGPARRAGVETGDRIVEVDRRSTYRWTADEALRALSGEPGSTARLVVLRPGVGRLSFAVERRAALTGVVHGAQMLDRELGYVQLSAFTERAATELRRAVDSLSTAGIRGLLLDLRGATGGSLADGAAVADLFLNMGDTIVQVRGKGTGADRATLDGAAQPWPSLTVAVLVDSASASASELVAGALQDHDRAIIVGSRTYGKGSAQTMFEVLGGGGVTLTVARWFTPLGRSIDRGGDTTAAPRARGAAIPAPPTFRTAGGRSVLGGGGILPDVIAVDSARARAGLALRRAVGANDAALREVITAYADRIRGTPIVRDGEFVVSPAMRAEVLADLKQRQIVVDLTTSPAVASALDRLIDAEVARATFGDDDALRRALRADLVVQRAAGLLRGAAAQSDVFTRARAK